MHDARPVCRSCGEVRLTPILALGHMPLANRLLTHEQLGGVEPRYPLELVLCRAARWCKSPKRFRRRSCFANTSTSRRSPNRCCATPAT